MAHELSIMDNGKAEAAFAVTPGWHGLGTVVPGLMTTAQALQAAHLDWEVEKIPALSSYDMEQIPDAFAIIRKDNKKALGVVGSRYTPINNTEAFSFFDHVMGATSARIDTAGALGRGERVWMMAKLPDGFSLRGQDRVEQYMLVKNTHNGTGPLMVVFTAVRVVCQNTLRAAMRRSSGIVTVRHCSSAPDRIKAAADVVKAQGTYWAELKEKCEALAACDVSTVEVGMFMETMFPSMKEVVDEDTGIATMEEKKRVGKHRDTVLSLFEGGQKGADMAGKTAWGLLNAYTEWVDHHREVRNSSNWEFSNFGGGIALRQKAFDTVCQMAGV